MNHYEEKIAFLGQWGRFQQVVFFLLCVSAIPNGFGVLSIIFVADIPSHHCKIPEHNLTREWLKSIIPVQLVDGKEELSRCSRYRLDVVRNLSAQGLIPGLDVNLTDLEQESCVDGWSYSKDMYQSTIVSEFDLVCNEQWKQPFTTTLYFLGVLMGSFFSGHLSDRYGRKPVLFASLAAQTIFTFVQIFATSWTVFSVLLFLSGLGQIANYMAAFVLGSEVLIGNVRVMFSTMGACISFSIGYMMLPLFAYFLRDWRSLLLAVSLPGVLLIPLWWFIPESPRWLLSLGRVEEAEAIVKKAAKQNKVEPPEFIFQDNSNDGSKMWFDTEERHNFLDLLRRSSSVRIITVILCMAWMVYITAYYGLSLNSIQLSADPYISSFLSAAVEVPAYVSCWLAMVYLPRRLAVICSALLGAVSLFFIQLVPQSLPQVSVTLEMLGKYGVTTASSLLYPYTTEIYPTVVRSTATGLCGTFSRVGTSLAPFLFQLKTYSKFLPYVILGSLTVVSASSILFLPETFGQALPETFQQMQKRRRVKCPCVTRKTEPVVTLESQL